MNYTDALSDFFRSPKWLNNLLLGGVCVLIPIVGPIALIGWHVTAMWARPDADDFTTYPSFDFKNFGTYLERGMWPFLTMMVVPLVMVPVMFMFMFSMVPLQIAAAQSHNHDAANAAGALAFLGFGGFMIIWMALILLITFLLRPICIAATLTQDFASAFRLKRLKQFIGLMWLEILLSLLFVWVAAIGLSIVGMVAFCVGMYFTMSLIYFMQGHLDRQLYRLYVARGGEPIPLSPKLKGVPPALPLS